MNFNFTHVQGTWLHKFSRNAGWEWPSYSNLYMTWNIWSFDFFFKLISWNFVSIRIVIGNPSVVLWAYNVFNISPWFVCWGEKDWVLCQWDPYLSTRVGTFNDMHSFAHNSPHMVCSWIIPILCDKEWGRRTEVYFLTYVIHMGVLITWWWWWWCPVAILVWNLINP